MALLLSLGSAWACHSEKKEPPSAKREAISSASAPVPSSSAAPTNQPVHLLSLALSAYHPGLFLEGDVVYLLTADAAYRLAEGQKPERFALELGLGPALTQSAFVFWSQGAVRRAPKGGGPTLSICEYAHQPQFFVASGERFAWIDRSEEGSFTIQTCRDGRSQALVSPPGLVAAATMLGERVFFVVAEGGMWKIGASAGPGKVIYGDAHHGRAPSMLSADAESIFYFDVDRLEIVRVSPDLQREDSWVQHVICSPLSVAAGAAYCGSVEGLFTVSNQNPKPKLLVENARSLVTSIAADARHVVWVRDVGPDQLSVELVSLR